MNTATLPVDQVRADLSLLGIDIAFKSAPAVVAGGAAQSLEVEEKGSKGRVRAIVSVTGVEDSVRDIIMPGAYAKTLKDRMPKVCWHHEWSAPIGRTDSIEEWAPGDPRLPKKTKDGKPWPAKAGALVADMVFNLRSERGREAFEAVKFYSESNECEWSIGYNVPAGASTKDRAGVRHIKSLDLYELSFVLFGAAPLSMTLDLKSVDLAQIATDWRQGHTPEPDADATEAALHEAGMPRVDWDQVKVAADAMDQPIRLDPVRLNAAADWRPEVGRLLTRAQATDAVKAGAALPDGSYPIESEHDLRAALAHVEAKGIADTTVREHVARAAVRLNRWDLVRPEAKVDKPGNDARPMIDWYVHGAGAAKIRWGTDGDFSRCVRLASKHMTPEQAKGFCNLRHREATGAAPGHAPGEGKAAEPADQAVPEVAPVDDQVAADNPGLTPVDDQTAATAADESVMTVDEIKDMLGQVGIEWEPETKTAEQAQVVIDRGSKGAESMIGKGVMVALPVPKDIADALVVEDGNPAEAMHITLAFLGDAETAQALQDDDAKREALVGAVKAAAAATGPLSGTIGGLGRFPDGGDGEPVWVPVDIPGLSEFRTELVKALDGAGIDYSDSHGYTPHITLGYDVKASVVPSTEITLDKVEVVIGGDTTDVLLAPVEEKRATAYDPALDGAQAAPETKAYVEARGTYEDRLRAVRDAARQALYPDVDGDGDGTGQRLMEMHGIAIEGTYADRVIVIDYSGKREQAYEMRYVITEDGDAAIVGAPTPVELNMTVTYLDAETPESGATAYAKSLIEEAGDLYRHLARQESKAGRVLSQRNAGRLSGAVESLLAILAAAGIQVNNPTQADINAESEATEQDGDWNTPPDSTSVGATRAIPPKATGKKDARPDGMEIITAAEMQALLAQVDLT